ncbi:MAG TPA: hypothetical protein VMH35_28510 [Streptosporangiaceae bacterium]|nr:hypothetical protein [Streptosporangiaceae bacterium]
MSAKGEGSTVRSPGRTPGSGRRGYQVARPRSNTWLWILNAIVIGFVVIAAFLASTRIGHTVAGASYHFALYYMGVLALIALTAEVGIGLVATDRIFMRPAGRVTMQAIHRATGFGAIAFLISHIILEIMAQRSTVADAVIPFLYPSGSKSFYLGLGTLASDMFILIMVIGVYRARLATRMSPAAWRVLHATAYVAWIFGLVHGLLGGRPAKAFFGYQGFVYWSYGFCVAAVALALIVRFVAQDRARNELPSQPVAEPPTGSSLTSAALAGLGGPGAAMTATALAGGPHAGGALEARPGAAARGGRPQLALPAATGSSSGRTGTFPAAGRLGYPGAMAPGQTARFGPGGAFDQLPADHPSAPFPRPQFDQFGADHPSGPLPQVGPPVRAQPAVPAGQRDWHAAYERPMGVRRPDGHAPGYERTGEIDRPGQSGRPAQFQRPEPRYERTGEIDRSGQFGRPAHYDQPPAGPRDGYPAGPDRSGPYPPPPARYDRPGPARPGPAPRSGPGAGMDWPGQAGRPYSRGPSAPDYGVVPDHGLGPYPAPDQYPRPAGTGQSGPYRRPAPAEPSRAEPPMGYDMVDRASGRYQRPAQDVPQYPSGSYPQQTADDGQAGPYQPPVAYDPREQYTRPGQYPQYDRDAQFGRERAEHYASFAEQDASYTRLRPPAARAPYAPQDETDPLNIRAVNTGY